MLAPLNRIGDETGARIENGQVRAVPGFAQAYRAFAEGGWNALAADPEHGGQGLPKALEIAVYEMIHSANMAFGLCPLLTQGAIEALATHGTERQKNLYLPKLISGEWTGTMNLTEPQAGSDLAALRTRAEPDGHGNYRLTGQKIFITWGDHDMTDNIVHLVLARIPGAPDGTKGVSLFLSSKRLVNDDGSLGAANDVGPTGIEHKLGIHGSPTCTMAVQRRARGTRGRREPGPRPYVHDDECGAAAGWRARRCHRGTRLSTGAGFCAGTQTGPLRLDGRISRAHFRSSRCAPHADADESTYRGGARDLPVDGRGGRSRKSVAGGAERESAKLREELFTPIAKAWATDAGVEVASIALQVHGGMGFIEETGAAQHYRDARIAPIYEGTNGIQAIDLMGRKLALNNGQAVRELIGRYFADLRRGRKFEKRMAIARCRAAARRHRVPSATRRGGSSNGVAMRNRTLSRARPPI